MATYNVCARHECPCALDCNGVAATLPPVENDSLFENRKGQPQPRLFLLRMLRRRQIHPSLAGLRNNRKSYRFLPPSHLVELYRVVRTFCTHEFDQKRPRMLFTAQAVHHVQSPQGVRNQSTHTVTGRTATHSRVLKRRNHQDYKNT